MQQRLLHLELSARVHPMIVDFRIPMLMLGTGLVLILAAIVRMRRGNRERRQ